MRIYFQTTMKRPRVTVRGIILVAVCKTAAAQNGPGLLNEENIVPSGETVSVQRLNHKTPAKAVSFFQRGVKFAEASDARRAAVEFQSAVAVDPEFAEAYGNLGVEYTSLGELEQAFGAFERAIQLDPPTGRYHENLAYTLYLLNRLGEAESEAQKAVALDRADPAARYMLGFLIAAHPERREEAFAHLLYAARQIREARLVLAILYHLSGADERAGAEMRLYREGAPPINPTR